MRSLKVGALILTVAFVSGCGMSKSQLRDVDALLQKAQEVPCEQVKAYIGLIQVEVQKELK